MPSASTNQRRETIAVREHESIKLSTPLSKDELAYLATLPGSVFKFRRNGSVAAANHVGIVTTERGLVIEILPKIDLAETTDPDLKKTREVFLSMLRCWRRLAKALPESCIRSHRRFPMLEVFFQQFLRNLQALVHSGLARRYIPVEENLPYLRGRIRFSEHIRENLTNQTRFFVAHDELSVNRPTNRLIRSTLDLLALKVRSGENRQLLRQLSAEFADVPPSTNPTDDWRKHHIDRSMRHYESAMRWVGLFLFNHGLTTFAGTHANLSLLFPMEQVFEDFVVSSFRRHQKAYTVIDQKPQKKLAKINGKEAFTMKPDISLMEGDEVKFILDAKWKEINTTLDFPKHGIDQKDMYQLYAYGKRYECKALALVYPQNSTFTSELCYHYHDGLPMICLPFDVAKPEESVHKSIEIVQKKAKASEDASRTVAETTSIDHAHRPA